MSNSLLSGGNHYDLLINWEKRLAREIPFLSSFFSKQISARSSIFSVGCGTGRHLKELNQNFQCYLTGTDLDPTMIEEAKKRVPDAEFVVGDFLDPNLLSKRSFDAIYSLGNSIGLIASSPASFKPVIAKLYQHLKPRGILIFQILNTLRERNGWSPPRSVRTPNGEYVFLRGFSTDENFIHPEIVTLFRKSEVSDYELVTTGIANIPRITVHKMKELLEVTQFKNIEVYGSYNKDSYDGDSSTDMIFVCNKRG